MRAHFMENVSKALAVLKERNIHLENIGAGDIVDGNANLILGLIWTIMLHFQVRIEVCLKLFSIVIEHSSNRKMTITLKTEF
ncbi:unnamed protein product [Dibothriocephalus latus]|uniref:Calponin-homology (CH) domain-containing protein n=1 Tax=Dibothriocephalus latus TaxID=60516 RepID=A0A3P6UAT1_DIBLA|nr:unnamed protein product [Dibothriocephalus latus]